MTPEEWSMEETRIHILVALEDKEFVKDLKQKLGIGERT